jgi:hypothetical protein
MIFLQFSSDFTRFSKSATLLKLPFCAKDPAKIWNITTIPLVYRKHPRKTRGFAIGALGMGRPRSRPGKRWGMTTCSPRAWGCSKFGRKGTDGGARWWPAATAAMCGGSGDSTQCWAKKRRRTPLGVLRSRSRWSDGRKWRWAGELGGTATMAAGSSVWRVEGGTVLGFYRQASPVTSPWRRRCRRSTATSTGARTVGCRWRIGGPRRAPSRYGVVRGVRAAGRTPRGLGVQRMWKGHASAGVWPWATRGADAKAGRRVDARSGVRAQTCCWPSVKNWKTPKSCIKVHQTLNTKVVDLNTTYNFYKDHMGVFSLDFAQKDCPLWMPLNFSEQEVLSFGQVFHLFSLKIWNANLHESCVPQQAGQLS